MPFVAAPLTIEDAHATRPPVTLIPSPSNSAPYFPVVAAGTASPSTATATRLLPLARTVQRPCTFVVPRAKKKLSPSSSTTIVSSSISASRPGSSGSGPAPAGRSSPAASAVFCPLTTPDDESTSAVRIARPPPVTSARTTTLPFFVTNTRSKPSIEVPPGSGAGAWSPSANTRVRMRPGVQT
jgi:hypothetical protein